MLSTMPATGFPDAADTVTRALSLARALSLTAARTLLPIPAPHCPDAAGSQEPADTVTHALSLLARRQPPTPRTMFTVTAYLGGSTYGFDTMREATEVTTDDGAPLRLIFTTSTATTAEEAATTAHRVGGVHLVITSAGEEDAWAGFAVDRSRQDDTGQSWPTNTRALEPGDVLAVTSPQGAVTRFAVEPTGILPLHPA